MIWISLLLSLLSSPAEAQIPCNPIHTVLSGYVLRHAIPPQVVLKDSTLVKLRLPRAVILELSQPAEIQQKVVEYPWRDRMAQLTELPLFSTTDILRIQSHATVVEGDLYEWVPTYRARGFEQVHIRGGRNTEVAFFIDGLPISNPTFGGQAGKVSPYSLAEMVIMEGGMSAEFGNAMSGVVNMITRSGDRRKEGNFELTSSELTNRRQDDLRNLTHSQGFLGGPVPGMEKGSFFLSGTIGTERDYLTRKDDILFDTTPESSPDSTSITYDPSMYHQTGPDGRPIFGGDLLSGWVAYGFHHQWSALLNLSFRVTTSQKLTITGQKSSGSRSPYDPDYRYSMLWGIPERYQQAWTMGIPTEGGDINNSTDLIPGTGFVEYENETAIVEENSNRTAGIWTHQLSQSTFYSLRASYHAYRRTMRVKRWINTDGYHSARRFYYDQLASSQDPLWSPDDPMIQVTLLPIPYNDTDIQNRQYGYARLTTGPIGWIGSDRFYENQFDDTRTLKGDITSQLTTHHQVRIGFIYNRYTLDLLDHQNPYYWGWYNHFHKSPWQLGFYLQDKVEYDFAIMNLGIRYDACYLPEIPYWPDALEPTSTTPFNPDLPHIFSGGVSSQISPRLGVSHPLSERSVIYFNYGKFYQLPIYRAFYLGYPFYQTGVEGVLGNPNLERAKSDQYELGYKQQLSEVFAFEIAVWGKHSSYQVGTAWVPQFYRGYANTDSYAVVINNGSATSRGIDLVLTKRYSDFFSVRLCYTHIQTETNWDYLFEGYHKDHPVEGELVALHPSRWNQPHRISAYMNIRIPEDAGPDLLGFTPLERINIGLTYRAAAGWPYTPRVEGTHPEPFSGRRPWTHQCDLKIYRDFTAGGLHLSLFLDIRNLFDRRNVLTVYSSTGRADDPGPEASSYSDAYDRFHYYGIPRLINLGLRFFF